MESKPNLITTWWEYKSIYWWQAIYTVNWPVSIKVKNSKFREDTSSVTCIEIEDQTSLVEIRDCIISCNASCIECISWAFQVNVFWDVTMTVSSSNAIFTKPVTIDPTV